MHIDFTNPKELIFNILDSISITGTLAFISIKDIEGYFPEVQLWLKMLGYLFITAYLGFRAMYWLLKWWRLKKTKSESYDNKNFNPTE